LKAHLPYEYDNSAKGRRRQAVATAMLLFARSVHESEGFGVKRLTDLFAMTDLATEEVTDWRYGRGMNTTWADEIDWWADQMELPVPKGDDYCLMIPGEYAAGGEEQRRLVLLLFYALSKLGYGKDRLQRVCRHYADVAGFDNGGLAKHTRKELRKWADEIGLRYI